MSEITKFSVVVTEAIANPGAGQTPEQPFVVPNKSAYHLLMKNRGPANVTIFQDGAFITPLPKGQAVLRTFRTPGRFSVVADRATVDISVLAVEVVE